MDAVIHFRKDAARAHARICLSSRRMAATLLSKAKVCSVAASSLVITVPSAWQRRHRSSTVRYLASESVAWRSGGGSPENGGIGGIFPTPSSSNPQAGSPQALPWVGVTNSVRVFPPSSPALPPSVPGLYFRPCRPRAAPAERRRWTRFPPCAAPAARRCGHRLAPRVARGGGPWPAKGAAPAPCCGITT